MSIFQKGTLDVSKPPLENISPIPIVGLIQKYVPPSYVVASHRYLDPVLEHILDTWLVNNHLAQFQDACEQKLGNLIVSLANQAFAEMKVIESTGRNDGTIVELLQKTCGNRKGDSWCMDQQQSAVSYAEHKLNTVSLLACSGSCLETLNNSPAHLLVKLEVIQAGDIYIWEHGTSGLGHTENFHSWIVKNHSMLMYGGNTTAGYIGGKLIRDGGGSHETQRATGSIGDMIPKGIIRAF